MKILIAGDFCDRYRVSDKIREGLYSFLFDEVKPIIEEADYSFVNFEFPIVLNEGEPIPKCGPNLKGQEKSIDAIKYAGFNACTLANNHILDQGEKCCIDTKRLLEDAGINTVGAGKSLEEASEILYLKKDKEVLAVINCCEHEFSISTETSAGANPLNPIQQFYKIQEAKKNADYVLVIVHGGHEHFQLPSPRMKETYRFFIDAGADAVVNHHQHCYSGYELFKGKPIFYGLGNFCFDIYPIRNNDLWNYGYMVELEFNNDILSLFKIIPYKQCDEIVGVHLLDKNEFSDNIAELNYIIGDISTLRKNTDNYYRESSSFIRTVFEPLQNRIMLGLQRRQLMPSFLSLKHLLKIENYTLCESHIDKVKYFLEKNRKKQLS